jgi:hypothetical protein
MSNAANAALASPWKDLWNGDLDVISQIIAEDFVAHAAPLTGTGTTELHGRQALSRWGTRSQSRTAALRCRTWKSITFGDDLKRFICGAGPG